MTAGTTCDICIFMWPHNVIVKGQLLPRSWCVSNLKTSTFSYGFTYVTKKVYWVFWCWHVHMCTCDTQTYYLQSLQYAHNISQETGINWSMKLTSESVFRTKKYISEVIWQRIHENLNLWVMKCTIFLSETSVHGGHGLQTSGLSSNRMGNYLESSINLAL